MTKLICDLCGNELDKKDNYDEDGYSQFVHVEVCDSRTYGGYYDICNDCYSKILAFCNLNLKKEDHSDERDSN